MHISILACKNMKNWYRFSARWHT